MFKAGGCVHRLYANSSARGRPTFPESSQVPGAGLRRCRLSSAGRRLLRRRSAHHLHQVAGVDLLGKRVLHVISGERHVLLCCQYRLIQRQANARRGPAILLPAHPRSTRSAESGAAAAPLPGAIRQAKHPAVRIWSRSRTIRARAFDTFCGSQPYCTE